MDMYSSDTAMAWKKRLNDEWRDIRNKLLNHNIRLDFPIIEISNQRWGKYISNPGGFSTISLSRELFNNYNWGAILHVFKHEIAHYIVDVAWHMGDLKSHGEAFSKACLLLGVDDRRCSSAKDLLDEDMNLINKERVVEKIKKIMALTASSEQAEAETALRKAQDMMLKYNIDSLDERVSDEYLFRPIGPVMKKVPNYIRDLAGLIHEYYFVNHVLCEAEYWQGRYYEFFGTKENLDIAEYIFCCLLHQAEKLWESHAAEIRKKHGGLRGYAGKNSFIEGLISGYASKLDEQQKIREESHSINSLIWVGDPLMQEMYHKNYPTLRNYSYSHTSMSGGYRDGFNKGKNLSLNIGLTPGSSNGNRCKQLNG